MADIVKAEPHDRDPKLPPYPGKSRPDAHGVIAWRRLSP
jgi:hypothetical protein